MAEMETGTIYVKPGEDSKKISNEILGNICYRMQVQLTSDQWKNCGNIIEEVASKNFRYMFAAAWNGKVTKNE